jgi:flagellar protein FliO/FliZ
MIRRVLLLLVGTALAAAPLRAATPAAPDDKALGYFAHTPDSPVPPASGYGASTIIGILLLGGAGGWLFLRGRKIQLTGRVVRKLVIDETKSLGSRQYLVVASYEGRKLLLGVCPGKIDLLTRLDSPTEPGKAQ